MRKLLVSFAGIAGLLIILSVSRPATTDAYTRATATSVWTPELTVYPVTPVATPTAVWTPELTVVPVNP